MSQEREDALASARLQLFRKKGAGFIAGLYYGLDMSWDSSIPTACTNGITLRINEEFFMNQLSSKEERATLLAHEVWHVGLLHPIRIGNRKPKRWNKACDYAINIMLENAGYTPLKGWLCDRKYDGMSAEQIYALLPDEPDDDDNTGGDVIAQGDDPNAQPSGGSGNNTPLTSGQQKQILTNVVRATQQQNMASKDQGWMPGYAQTQINELLRPKLPWDLLVKNWLCEVSRNDYTWQRPSRRFNDIYMPSLGGEEGLEHLCWCIDSSGSVTDEQLTRFNSEVKAAKDLYNPKRMTIIVFDTDVRDVYEFSEDDDFSGLTFTGRGGTNMQPAFDMAMKMHPTAIVMFSDNGCREPKDPGIPVLFIVVDNEGSEFSFGRSVHVTT